MRWHIVIPLASPGLNEIIGKNHYLRSKERDDWFFIIRAAPTFLGITPASGKRHLRIERHGKREMDLDNIIGGAKQVITDNLIKLKLLVDDKPQFLDISAANGTLNHKEKPYTILILEDV